MKLWSTFGALALVGSSVCDEPIQVHCDKGLYGKPEMAREAIQRALPYACNTAECRQQAEGPRVFGEPKFLVPSFSELHGQNLLPMVQLPKIWRYLQTRIAVLSYTNAAGVVERPYFVSNWQSVHAAVEGVLHYCFETSTRSGGVWIVHNQDGKQWFPYKAVYVYQPGSDFEEILNTYMIHDEGINPYDPRSLESNAALNATQFQQPLTVGNVTAKQFGVVPSWAGFPSINGIAAPGSVGLAAVNTEMTS